MTTSKLEKGYVLITKKMKVSSFLLFIILTTFLMSSTFFYSKNYIVEPFGNPAIRYESSEVKAELVEVSKKFTLKIRTAEVKIANSEEILALPYNKRTDFSNVNSIWFYPETENLDYFKANNKVLETENGFYSFANFEVKEAQNSLWLKIILTTVTVTLLILQCFLNAFTMMVLFNSKVARFKAIFFKKLTYRYPYNKVKENQLDNKPLVLIGILNLITFTVYSYLFLVNANTLSGSVFSSRDYISSVILVLMLTFISTLISHLSDLNCISNFISKIAWGKNLNKIQTENISFEDEAFLKEFSRKLSSDKIDAEVIEILAPAFTGSLRDLKENAKVLSQDEA